MIHIILGKASSGKSEKIFEEIAQRVRAKEQKRILVVVPEQYSHSCERHLAQTAGAAFSLYGEVLGFSRLARRILTQAGVPLRSVHGGLTEKLRLYRVLTENAELLSVYGGALRGIGTTRLLPKLYGTLRALSSSGLTAERLLEAAETASGETKGKLTDLALLLADDRLLMPDDDTTQAAELLLSEPELCRNTVLYFDGFHDFTYPERQMVAALIACGAEMTFCFTADRLGGQPGDYLPDEYLLPAREAARVLRAAERCGADCEVVYQPPEDGKDADCPAKELEVVTAKGDWSQAETAAYIIRRLTSQEYRYRDIAVMTRSIGALSKTARNVFGKFGIPAYLSGRTPAELLAPIRFIRTALDCITEGYSDEVVIAHIKTGQTAIGRQGADFLELFIRRFGISGRKMLMQKAPWAFVPAHGGFSRDEDEKNAQTADELRRVVIAPLVALEKRLSGTTTVRERLSAIIEFCRSTELYNSTATLAEELRREGDEQSASELEAFWGVFSDSMDAVCDELGAIPVSAREFSRILELVFSEMTVGSIPASLDAVLIGDFSFSRKRGVRALIVLDAHDGSFPAAPEQSGVLTEREEALLRSCFPELTQEPDDDFAREAGLIYASLSETSEKLFFICPEGKTPSSSVTALMRSYGAQPQKYAQEQVLSSAAAPYSELLAELGFAQKTAPSAPQLSPDTALRLYGKTVFVSPSRAEKWFGCRYRFFLEDGLRLSDGGPDDLDARLSGTILHSVFSDLIVAAAEQGGVGRLSTEDAQKIIAASAGRRLTEDFPDLGQRRADFRELVRLTFRRSSFFAERLAQELRYSDFSPAFSERRFSFEPETGLVVRGVIDRLDVLEKDGSLYYAVFDYKSGKKDFSPAELLAGKNMQLPIYLAAAGHPGAVFPAGQKTTPAGALFTRIGAEFSEASESTLFERGGAGFTNSGLLLSGGALDTADALYHGENKKYLPIAKAVGGGFTKRSEKSLYTGEEISLISRAAAKKLMLLGRELRSGDISRRPLEYKTCAYCPMASGCLFGTGADDRPAGAPRLTKEEALAALKNEEGRG
jgi:ATP-dependent helicase/nuclease subunit B